MTDKKSTARCDMCGQPEAKRKDIKTNWFRGDDVVLMLCALHRKPEYEQTLLKLPKAIKQMEN